MAKINSWFYRKHKSRNIVNTNYGCLSAENAYSSMAPDSTFAHLEGPFCPTLNFVSVVFVTFSTILTSWTEIEKKANMVAYINISKLDC
jgi:hypothetical protein